MSNQKGGRARRNRACPRRSSAATSADARKGTAIYNAASPHFSLQPSPFPPYAKSEQAWVLTVDSFVPCTDRTNSPETFVRVPTGVVTSVGSVAKL
jgi:hypothetical protein